MYSNLLIPTDGSKLSDKAVQRGLELAKALRAKVTLFHASPDYPAPMFTEGVTIMVMPKREYEKRAKAGADKIFARATAKARAAGVSCTTAHTISGAPWEAILAAAKKGKCDLIVMASHGRSGLAGFLLGSETAKVLTHSKTPVLVVR